MKTSITSRTLLFFVCVTMASVSSFAKKDKFCDGYIITVKGDTIHGALQFYDWETSCKKVTLMMDSTTTRDYKPAQLNGYQRGEERFIACSFKKGGDAPEQVNQVFLKVIREGIVSYYEHTYIVYLNNANPSYVKDRYLLRNGEELFKVRPLKFRKEGSQYFSDYPQLAQMISSTKLIHTQLDYIVDQYNKKMTP